MEEGASQREGREANGGGSLTCVQAIWVASHAQEAEVAAQGGCAGHSTVTGSAEGAGSIRTSRGAGPVLGADAPDLLGEDRAARPREELAAGTKDPLGRAGQGPFWEGLPRGLSRAVVGAPPRLWTRHRPTACQALVWRPGPCRRAARGSEVVGACSARGGQRATIPGLQRLQLREFVGRLVQQPMAVAQRRQRRRGTPLGMTDSRPSADVGGAGRATCSHMVMMPMHAMRVAPDGSTARGRIRSGKVTMVGAWRKEVRPPRPPTPYTARGKTRLRLCDASGSRALRRGTLLCRPRAPRGIPPSGPGGAPRTPPQRRCAWPAHKRNSTGPSTSNRNRGRRSSSMWRRTDRSWRSCTLDSTRKCPRTAPTATAGGRAGGSRCRGAGRAH